ncbi:MAG TPA: GNAT family protein [Deltaproteobacteria bacterium]|nr:GNAT family protein [Deltaproteobacteria bacterium]HPJ92495.1 GNAT family protein [Deltaproteobacteria bacterium]HPR52155.1 GNAT family protein [Deltaproteobacteria bacterium]
MLIKTLWSIEAPWTQGMLRVFEPTQAEVLAAAPLLAAFYNDSHNSAMLTNTCEMTAPEVVETHQTLRANGGRTFLLEQDGVLMGDADFRNITGSEAEFAILIGSRTQQSRGLGTRFAAMMHIAALRVFGFKRVYATIIPMNIASRRMLEKLGYQPDQSSRAASFTDTEDDIAMSIDWAQFKRSHAELLTQVVITARTPSPD